MDKEKILKYLKENLSSTRYNHTLCVMKKCRELSELYSENIEKSEIAGLLHDCCKEMTTDKMLQYIDESDIIYENEFYSMQHIWHGFCGSVIAREIFFITDIEILNAIKYHTVARPFMSNLEKIVFMADLISEDRQYKDVEKIREDIKGLDLNNAFTYVLKESILFLISKNKPIYKETIDSYNYYIK